MVNFTAGKKSICCSFCLIGKLLLCVGGRNSSVVLSPPAILQPRVRIPSTPSMLFFNLYYLNCIEKIMKINKKRPGLAHFKKDKTIDQNGPPFKVSSLFSSSSYQDKNKWQIVGKFTKPVITIGVTESRDPKFDSNFVYLSKGS